MSSKKILFPLFFCLAISVFASEFKYTKPVKALVKVSVTENEYCVTGLFEREKMFSTAVNHAREKKYIRLFAENALIRYLKKNENMNSVSFSGADISSNLTTAGPDEKISFKYVVPFAGCKITRNQPRTAASSSGAVTKDAPASEVRNPPDDNAKTDKEKTSGDKCPADKSDKDQDTEAVTFEIASPQTVFDASWKLSDDIKIKSQQNINQLISDFEKQRSAITNKN